MNRWVLTLALVVAPLQAALITNGGFESGFTGWTRADQAGSDGSFLSQTGSLSPLNALPVAAPPGGSTAAMTDAGGPGSHALYQDIVVPGSVTVAILTFSLYINSQAPFVTPATLSFDTPALNQQARVDLMRAGASAFSVAAADILQNVFATAVSSPQVSGYTTYQADITAILQANLGQTLRLRFAEVDNLAIFNFGVDNVDVLLDAQVIPEPSTWMLAAGVLAGLSLWRRSQK